MGILREMEWQRFGCISSEANPPLRHIVYGRHLGTLCKVALRIVGWKYTTKDKENQGSNIIILYKGSSISSQSTRDGSGFLGCKRCVTRRLSEVTVL